MTSNLDLVRSIYATGVGSEDWWRRLGEWADPRIEFVRPDGPELGTWTGRERVEEVTRDIFSAWDDYRQHPEEYRELDDERVLVIYRRSGRGKTSGMEITELGRGAALIHIRDGKVTRIVAYFDSDHGLADLGLEGQGMPEKPMTLSPNLDEIQRKFIEAANRGDIDAAFGTPLFQPDAVWDDSAIEGGTYEGLASIREHAQEWVGSFEDVERVREEICDLGNGVTLTVWRQKARPLGSMGWVQIRYAGVSIWADGLIERLTTYTDIDEARAAAERLAEERR